MPTKRFKIEKVPLTYHPTDHQPVFPPFPVLYLELLENIYDPYCKNRCLISHEFEIQRTISNSTNFKYIYGEEGTLVPLFESTFHQLHTIKKLYNRIVIFYNINLR